MDIANQEQHRAWNGDEGEHWTAHAPKYEQSGRFHRPHLMTAAALADGERVLDIGCGTGRSTIDAARLIGGGSSLGVDLSAPMLAYARAQAAEEGVTNVEFVQADAQVHPFEPASADVAISETGCMFFGDPVAAFTNIGTALRPGGRLALQVWRELQRNDWLTKIRGALALGRDLPAPPPDAPGHPFSMANADRVRATLDASGFDTVELAALDVPVDLGNDADDAFSFLGSGGMTDWLLEGVDDAGRSQAMDNLRTVFKEAETADGVLLDSSAWIITATRR